MLTALSSGENQESIKMQILFFFFLKLNCQCKCLVFLCTERLQVSTSHFSTSDTGHARMSRTRFEVNTEKHQKTNVKTVLLCQTLHKHHSAQWSSNTRLNQQGENYLWVDRDCKEYIYSCADIYCPGFLKSSNLTSVLKRDVWRYKYVHLFTYLQAATGERERGVCISINRRRNCFVIAFKVGQLLTLTEVCRRTHVGVNVKASG